MDVRGKDMNVKFKYKDIFTKGKEWSYQECEVSSVAECLRIYGLETDDTVAYELLSVDGQLTKFGKLDFIEKLKQNPYIRNLGYDKTLLEDGRDDSIWYDDSVLWFTIVNEKEEPLYEYSCRACGDVCIVIGDDYVKAKGGNCNRVREFLISHKLINDKLVCEAEFNGLLSFENNNWFEDFIYDVKSQKYITDNYCMDISDGPFTVDLDFINEIIRDYEGGNK